MAHRNFGLAQRPHLKPTARELRRRAAHRETFFIFGLCAVVLAALMLAFPQPAVEVLADLMRAVGS